MAVDLTTFYSTGHIFSHSLKKLTSWQPNPNLKISVHNKPKPQIWHCGIIFLAFSVTEQQFPTHYSLSSISPIIK